MELMRVLSENELAKIRRDTEDLLATTGMGVTHPELLRLCHQAGAQVDKMGGARCIEPGWNAFADVESALR